MYCGQDGSLEFIKEEDVSVITVSAEARPNVTERERGGLFYLVWPVYTPPSVPIIITCISEIICIKQVKAPQGKERFPLKAGLFLQRGLTHFTCCLTYNRSRTARLNGTGDLGEGCLS